MIFFISTAMADGAASGGAGGLVSFLPMLFFIGVIYFLLIRPQQKRAKQHQALVSSVKKGDKVVTNSGIIGTVVKVVNDQEVLIEISDKVIVKFVKSTISTVVTATQNAQPVQEGKSQEPKPAQIEEGQKGTSVKKEDFSEKPKMNRHGNSSGKYYPKRKPANKTDDVKKQ